MVSLRPYPTTIKYSAVLITQSAVFQIWTHGNIFSSDLKNGTLDTF